MWEPKIKGNLSMAVKSAYIGSSFKASLMSIQAKVESQKMETMLGEFRNGDQEEQSPYQPSYLMPQYRNGQGTGASPYFINGPYNVPRGPPPPPAYHQAPSYGYGQPTFGFPRTYAHTQQQPAQMSFHRAVNEGGSPMKSSQRAPFYESMAGLSLQETAPAPPTPPTRNKPFSWAQVVGGGGSSKPSGSPQTQFNRGPNKLASPTPQAYDSMVTAAPSGRTHGGPYDGAMHLNTPSSPDGPSSPFSSLRNINPIDFDINPPCARFFVIKSFSEDDVHKSVKYGVWASTEGGNQRLDRAFRESGGAPIYLFFSVNESRQFCGMAQMVSSVDYHKTFGGWLEDKWKGQFKVRWIFCKDIPNSQLRHIILPNNENKPVTNSRDTQEVPFPQGKEVLRIFHSYQEKRSLLDDFTHYDTKQVHREQVNQYQAPPAQRDVLSVRLETTLKIGGKQNRQRKKRDQETENMSENKAEEGDTGADDGQEQDNGDRAAFEHERINGAAYPQEQGKEIQVTVPSENGAIVNGTIPTADE